MLIRWNSLGAFALDECESGPRNGRLRSEIASSVATLFGGRRTWMHV